MNEITKLKKEITKEKRMGYKGLCYDVNDLNEDVIETLLIYINENYCNVKYYKDGFNDNRCNTGKFISFDI